MTELLNVQKWFTSILVKPGTVYEKIQLADSYYGLDHQQMIDASEKLSAPEKIGIYARGYFYRLLECMRAEFPALRELTGDELFETFVRSYLANVPSKTPDLFDLSKDFPAFLKASQSTLNPELFSDPAVLDLPVEMTMLERTISEVSRCRGTEQMGELPEAPEQLTWAFGIADLETSPSLRLLKQQFSMIEFVRKAYSGQKAPTPEKRETFVAVTRKNYNVRMAELEKWQYYFLKALQSGGNYTGAIETVAAVCAIQPDVLMADLLFWISLAIDTGYLLPAGFGM